MRRDYFLNGLPELLIFRLLSARGEMYGYEIVAQIKILSRQTLHFAEGAIYPLLHRLAKKGFFLERKTIVKGRARRNYRLSAAGRKQLAHLNRRWSEVTSAIAAIEAAL